MEVAEEVVVVGLGFAAELAADVLVAVGPGAGIVVAVEEDERRISVPTHSIDHYQQIVKEGLQLLMVYYLWPFSTFEGYPP